VNSEGEDAGIVYCEMQARENSGHSLTHCAFLKQMYPGHCGYKVIQVIHYFVLVITQCQMQ